MTNEPTARRLTDRSIQTRLNKRGVKNEAHYFVYVEMTGSRIENDENKLNANRK